jgi:hypothetical protein
MTHMQRLVDLCRKREVAARHGIDPRTLDRAIEHGPEAIKGMAADRARKALEELGLGERHTGRI